MKKLMLAVSMALLLCAGFAVVIWKELSEPEVLHGIATQGGETFSVLNAGVGNYYLQGDPRWAEEPIGGSAETIGRVGCTLCSVAMAVSDMGLPMDPATLNRRMIENGGFTERGWLVWGAVSPSTEKFAEAVYVDKPSFESLDACLKRGDFPIVKFFLPGSIPHWVVVVGKRDREYLVKDPAVPERQILKLSERADRIHSLRFIRRRQAPTSYSQRVEIAASFESLSRMR